MKLWNTLLILALFMTSFAFAEDLPAIPPRGGEGTVSINLEPAGSTVYLDGEEIGKAPLKNVKFRSGRHDLLVIDQEQELINARFNVWPDSLNVYQGKTTMPFGNIEITTKPDRCHIFLDGERADYTDGGSLMLKNLDVGDHIIKAKCGRRSKEVQVKVEGEQTAKVTIDVRKK